MAINFKLKREGIEIVEKLDTSKVNKIAINVVNKLCATFPEHSFDRAYLFEIISRLSMYTAKMPDDSSGAKYIFNNNAIYFNKMLDLEEMSNVAVHECIHCIQHSYAKDQNLVGLGLCDSSSNVGLALNEAAVQLMASEANSSAPAQETYYGISINTISPNYYPLECTLANQITYFTGTYPFYHSTLYGNNIFKNIFTLKTDLKTYNTIIKNFDKLLSLENDLNFFVSELQYASSAKSIKSLNNIINKNKKEINNTFFKTQNLIMKKCFKNEFNNIRNLEDVISFNKKIYNYKDLIGYSDDYTFYNEFYRKMMSLVQEKKEYIDKYGTINLFEEINKSLTIVDNSRNLLSFINKFVTKLKKLVKLNKNTEDEINF